MLIDSLSAAIMAVDNIDTVTGFSWQAPVLSNDTIAFLQYTSGSTATPKGVIVGHGNLIANEKAIQRRFEITQTDSFVSWLPLFHDMGLVGGLMQPLFSGIPLTLMSPKHFLERPVRWLEAITRYGGSISGGPNFAYRLCVERIGENTMDSLDLSTWRIAFCGAEPIRQETLAAFAEKFEAAGLNPNALYPCYGLAESTLLVTGGCPGRGVNVVNINTDAMAAGRLEPDAAGQPFVNCGAVQDDHTLTLMHPQTGEAVDDHTIGEVWVSGPSVAQGYWRNEVATAAGFVGMHGKSWLRTGDLAFIHNGELFITGRLKDLILVRGQNLYPQDLEILLEEHIDVLRKGRIAAFAVDRQEGEGIGIAAEIGRSMQKLVPPQALFELINETLAQTYQEPASLILLLQPGTLPKTTSGKLQRRACWSGWQNGTLEPYAVYRPDQALLSPATEVQWSDTEQQVATLFQQVLRVSVTDRGASFFALGGNSIDAMHLLALIRERFAIDLEPSVVFEAPTVIAFASHLDSIGLNPSSGADHDIVRHVTTENDFPLSYAQQRIWFHHQLAPENTAYHMTGAVRIHGKLLRSVLEQTLLRLAQRHESLRTLFVEFSEMPRQLILAEPVIDLQWVTEDEIDRNADRQESSAIATALRPFDLVKGPLWRLLVIERGHDTYELYLVMHHIIADGWSVNVLLNELARIYTALPSGSPLELPELPVRYVDYAIWQRSRMDAGVLASQQSYWIEQLGKEQSLIHLPMDHPRPAAPSGRGDIVRFSLSPVVSARFRESMQAAGTTVFMGLLTAFAALLYRYSGQPDVRIGVPVTNRNQMATTGIIGLFVNMLVLRTHIKGPLRFHELLQHIRAIVLVAHNHAEIPFDQLVDALQPVRELGISPLFQVLYNHLQVDYAALEKTTGWKVERIDWSSGGSQFDLSLETEEDPDGTIRGVFVYAADLFDRATIERMAAHFQSILTHWMQDPAQRLGALQLEQAGIKPHPDESEAAHFTPVFARISQLALQQPDGVALIDSERHITYGEMERQSSRIAQQLLRLGVGAEHCVGLLAKRGVDLVIGALGILKAGAAYVPLDPDYPRARMHYILEDARIHALLLQKPLELHLDLPAALNRIYLDLPEHGEDPDELPAVAVTPQQLAYVIYTSGSTGQPKGVGVAHGPLAMHCQAITGYYGLQPSDCALHAARFTFDAAVEQWLVPLLAGARLLINDPGAWGVEEMVAAINAHGVTLIYPPTAPILQLADWAIGTTEKLPVRLCTVGGEAVARDAVERIHQGLQPQKLINGYGPTEAIITPLLWTATAETTCITPYAPIGQAVGDRTAYVLDNDLNIVPVGVTGELYIGGSGLARGYFHRPALTAECFIPDPFGLPGSRMYRTRDLARRLANGDIEYLGRSDRQIKLRGYRIELGEIEAQLLTLPEVREACVTLQSGSASARLIAYVATASNPAEAAANAKEALEQRLPGYMVPSVIIAVEHLPRTAHGKVDYAALPDPEPEYKTRVMPRTELEHRLADIWQALLKIEGVGVTDNFFELGGDSIIALQVVSRARNAGINFSPATLFRHQSIEKLVEAIAVSVGSQPVSAAEPEEGDVPFAPVQADFFAQAIPARHHWNQSLLLRLRQPVVLNHLACALAALIAHHDALRLRYRQTPGGWSQHYTSRQAATDQDLLWVREVSGQHELEQLCAAAQISLDLERGPLVRAVHITHADKHQGLLLVIHHLVVDGVSWRILLEDLEQAYKQLTSGASPQLPAITQSFRQHAQALNDYAQHRALAEQADYWHTVTTGAMLGFPFDAPNTATCMRDAAEIVLRLDRRHTRMLLEEASQAYRTRIDELLLVALVRTAANYRNAEVMIVEVESHGRHPVQEQSAEIDLSRTIGWFTAIYPVRLAFSEDLSRCIKQVKEALRNVPHEGLGYGLLRHCAPSALREQANTWPRPTVTLNYLGRLDVSLGTEGSLFGWNEDPSGQDRDTDAPLTNALEINAYVYNGELVLNWRYSSAQYREDTMRSLVAAYRANLEEIITHCLGLETGGATPSDFPLAQMRQEDLDALGQSIRQIEDIYPLTALQQGILYHALETPETDAYFYQRGFLLRGALSVSHFQRAWEATANRHAALCSNYRWEGLNTPIQIVCKSAAARIIEADWRGLGESEQWSRFDSLLQQERQQGFDFGAASSLRLRLIRVAQDAWWFVWSQHHIVLDGWSMGIVLRDVMRAYHAYRHGQSWHGAASYVYADYLHWLAKRDQAQALDYWQRQLAGFDTPTPLSGGRLQGLPGYGELSCSLDVATTRRIQETAQNLGVTLNTLVQGAWALILGRYCGQSDAVFGITVSGRSAAVQGIEEWVGLLINTVPLRVRMPENETVATWLQRLQRQNFELQAYEDTPLHEIQRASEVREGLSLFETILVFENYPLDEALLRQSDGLAIDLLEAHRPHDRDDQPGRNNFPLSVIASLHQERLTLAFSWRNDRMDKNIIHTVAEYMLPLIEQLAAGSSLRLGDISLGVESGQERFKGEPHAREPLPVLAAWSRWVAERPNDVAIQYEDCRWSYTALDQAANRLARMLLNHGVTADDCVGLYLTDRSAEWVLSILGVFKTGAAYLPLTQDLPAERAYQLLNDAGARWVITDQRDVAAPLQNGFTVIRLDDPQIARNAADAVIPSVSPDHLAYVIYTSGSTGRPKGVAISHRALSHYVDGALQRLALSGSGSMAMISTPMADLGNTVLFGALVSGSLLHLISAERAADPAALGDYMQEHNVAVLKIVPGHLRGLIDAVQDGSSVLPSEMLIVGGEAADPALIRRVRTLRPQCRIVNHYGPAETCVGVLTHEISDTQSMAGIIPIGQPLPDVRVYVLDAELNSLPAGIPGELYIGGTGLARGYHDNPAATADRFIPDPFNSGERLYRSGDRVMHQGEWIEFLGRSDDQIKLRGYRIELGEIAQQLRAMPGVRDCAVVPQVAENGMVTQLLGYYVSDDAAQYPADALQTALADRLPEYMVPALTALDVIPRTRNGKVDREALPLSGKSPDKVYRAPRSELEQLLCEIWREVLGTDEIGIDDHFLALGGDSILSLQVIARVRRQGIKLTPRLMFEYPTIEQLAGQLSLSSVSSMEHGKPETTARDSIIRNDGMTRAPLSPAQERLWFLSQLAPESNAYHILGGLKFTGDLHRDALNSALSALVARHESLRTGLHEVAGEPYQIIQPAYALTVHFIDLSGLHDRATIASRLNDIAKQEAQRPFDLSQGRPLRATLIKCADGEFILLMSFHHVAVDGWSMNRLMAELAECYGATIEHRVPVLPSLPIRYIDYVDWQRRYLATAEGEKQLAYWVKQLSGDDTSSPLALPTDRPRLAADSYHGAVYAFELDAELTDRLRAWVQAEGVTVFMAMLTAFQILLYRLTGQPVIHLGIPVANRDRSETQGIVGLFVNTLVHRGELRGDLTVRSLLAAVRQTVLDAQAYQHLPFERLVEALQPERHLDHHPLFQVLYNHQKRDFAPLKQLPGLIIDRYQRAAANTQFELALHTEEDEGGIIKGTWAYATERFDADTILRWHGYFIALLNQLIDNKEQYVADLTIMNDNDRRLLAAWCGSVNSSETGFEPVQAGVSRWAGQEPARIAIEFGEARLSYDELERWSNRVAHRLRRLGVGTDTLVGVYMERSLELIVGILGILKAGGAYVALEPAHPVERLRLMAERAKLDLILTTADLNARIRLPASIAALCLDQDYCEDEIDSAPAVAIHPEQLAYVLYTSGSTGQPKAAGNTHRGLSNRLAWMQSAYVLRSGEGVLQKTPIGFDVSVWELLWPLRVGARMVLAAPGAHRDPAELVRLIQAHRITTLHFVPSMLQEFLRADGIEACQTLKHVICSGEALEGELASALFMRLPQIGIHNLYGPTECAIDVTHWACNRSVDFNRAIPIGKPIAQTIIRILDRDMSPVPEGVVGELYLGGWGVGRGYWGQGALTAERFVPDPYGQPGDRLYRSGDIGYWRTGVIEYVGRVDEQIKLRGQRIELGEITSQLLRQSGVREAAALVQEGYIVGYVTGDQLDAEVLRKGLRDYLPEAMVPAKLMVLEHLPKTVNGKLDRKALPAPEWIGSDNNPPETEWEWKLAKLWREILGIERIEQIGREDNFFDLGGHSLLAMRLVARLRDELQMNVSVRLIFEQPRLYQLAAEVAIIHSAAHAAENNLDTIDALLREMESS
jgi:amino acid adenylation domain-containing protein/non-ribosomal peptide synthase protein (TIGR01720 family)